jgi:hypothetical protein
MIVGGDVRVTGMVELVLFAMATRGANSEAGQCAKRSRRSGVGNSMTPPTTVKTALHVRTRIPLDRIDSRTSCFEC